MFIEYYFNMEIFIICCWLFLLVSDSRRLRVGTIDQIIRRHRFSASFIDLKPFDKGHRSCTHGQSYEIKAFLIAQLTQKIKKILTYNKCGYCNSQQSDHWHFPLPHFNGHCSKQVGSQQISEAVGNKHSAHLPFLKTQYIIKFSQQCVNIFVLDYFGTGVK